MSFLDGVKQEIQTMNMVNALSKEFNEFIKRIGEAQSKQEEERIVLGEIKKLKARLTQPGITPKMMKEYLIRLVHCEMLGHEVSFAYIHALNLAQTSKVLPEKCVGYLAASLFLHPDHELTILLVQSILKDLNSSNHIEVLAALTTLSRLASAEIVPAVLTTVQARLSHPKEMIRKKALMCFLRFHQVLPSSVTPLREELKKTLYDTDASVMGASLVLHQEMVRESPQDHLYLGPTFIAILKVIIDRKLPRILDYHGVPAPWHQISILKVLGLIGEVSKDVSEGMYQVLMDTLKRAEAGIDAAFAVIFECVRTITNIYPNSGLIEMAATSIGRFLNSNNNNLKYLGLTALTLVVKVDPKYATPHQLVVIDCLENQDETLKRKTLDLLFKMTNTHNVAVITEKMINYLRFTVDEYLRLDLVSRITQLAESNIWFLNTMSVIFELGGDLVRPEVAYSLMKLIAEGSGNDDEADNELRVQAVNSYATLLQKAWLPDTLLQIVAWVLGEYAYLTSEHTLEEILTLLANTLERPHLGSETKGWIITSITKVVAQSGSCPDHVREAINKFAFSKNVDLQQRCFELMNLVRDMPLMEEALPLDASCEDIEVDEHLSFLDDFVSQALARGAKKYVPQVHRAAMPTGLPQEEQKKAIRFEAYERPKLVHEVITAPAPSALVESQPEPARNNENVLIADLPTPEAPVSSGFLDAGKSLPEVKKKWGKSGYLNKAAPEPVQSIAPVSEKAPQSSYAATTSATTPVISPAKAVVVEAPRKPTEKELLAQSIFGGVGNAPASNAQTRSPAQKKEPVKAAAPTPSLSSPIRSQETPIPITQQAKASSLLLDLGGDLDFGAPRKEPALQPQMSTSSNSFDLLGGDDLLSLGTQPLLSGGLSVPKELAGNRGADKPFKEIASDEFLSVSMLKVAKSSAVVVLLGFTNSSSTTLNKFEIQYEVPRQYQVSFNSQQGQFQRNVFAVASVTPRNSISHTLEVKLDYQQAPAAISGDAVFVDPNGSKRTLPFFFSFKASDFLLPLRIKTADFGKKWVALTQESKISVETPMMSGLADLTKTLGEGLNLHLVEMIGAEGICAAVASGTGSVECLLHSKLDPSSGALLLTARSSSKTLCDAILKEADILVG